MAELTDYEALKDYEAVADSFEAGTLDAAGFTHVDHIGVACRMLKKYDFLEAAARYGRSLRVLAAGAGVPEKFNTTLTLAFLSILSERMAETPHQGFADFLAQNPDLQSRSLMAGWYSENRLGSDRAKIAFLMPDRFRTTSGQVA